MMLILDVLTALLLAAGSYFFTTGTIGLVRFPDVRSQLHALTKADNLGLGLILLAVALQIKSWPVAGVLLLTWLLALCASSVSAQVIAGLQVEVNSSGPAPDREVRPSSVAPLVDTEDTEPPDEHRGS